MTNPMTETGKTAVKDGNVFRWLVRKLFSQAANLTPNVIYYPKAWAVKINGKMMEIASRKGEDRSTMTTAAVVMACAMDQWLLKEGDSAEISLTGVTNKGSDLGSFVVNIRRVAA